MRLFYYDYAVYDEDLTEFLRREGILVFPRDLADIVDDYLEETEGSAPFDYNKFLSFLTAGYPHVEV